MGDDQASRHSRLVGALVTQFTLPRGEGLLGQAQQTGRIEVDRDVGAVVLKGTTLEQVVRLLHKIESARLHLIVRSLRITTRGKKSQVLDVSFSVSSFERA